MIEICDHDWRVGVDAAVPGTAVLICLNCFEVGEKYSESVPKARSDRAEEVVEVREEAIKRADSKPSGEWKQHAHEMIIETARRLPEFTSEDVWDSGLRSPDNGSPDGDALGPAMRRARTAGIIEFTGRTTTETNRPQRHNNPKRVWRSLTYGMTR